MELGASAAEKAYLGQEFLTWLWYLAEEEDAVSLPDGRPVVVLLGDRMTLAPLPGAEGTRVSLRGQEAALAEAREGLRRGKLLESLRLGLELEGQEYWLTVKAADLGVTALKLPAVAEDDEPPPLPPGEGGPASEGAPPPPGAGREGLVLERVALIENALEALEGLFGEYLRRRLGGHAARELKAWAARE